MGLSRRFLKELLADYDDRDELIDSIIDAHAETVGGLKNEIAKYTDDAEEYHRVAQEVERLRESGVSDGEWKGKYLAVHQEFEAAKAAAKQAEAKSERASLFRSLLLEEGVHPSFVNAVVRGGGELMNAMDISNGGVANEGYLRNAIRSEFADFITGDHRPTREKISSITDRSERLEAMQKNMELFS